MSQWLFSMDYFKILNLDKEPFSNSPDPDFFYHSRQHHDCLQKLELALRLRRGLNIVIGDVGTGKTTLCRQLIRKFATNDHVDTHLILDPSFTTPTEFLTTVSKIFQGVKPPDTTNDWQLKEGIKQYLYQQGVDDQKTTILIIDEGQKIPVFCLELLREFLNYETNEYKLLQIVIFAQNEFERTVREYANFADRINLYHHLKPLGFYDTRLMIKYRLEKSGSSPKTYTFFTFPALLIIYWATGGYPRKVINLCHRCILTMIVQNRTIVNLYLARSCIPRVFPSRTNRLRKVYIGLGVLLISSAAVFAVMKMNPSLPISFRSTMAPSSKQPFDQAIIESHIVMDQSITGTENSLAKVGVGQQSDHPIQSGDLSPSSLNPQQIDQTLIGLQPKTTSQSNTANPEGILGQITLMRNETLSGLIQTVYGAYNSKHFKSLILANPHIDDPDVVNVGQIIKLPAIPVAVQPVTRNLWWILINKTDSVDHAFQLIRSWPVNAPPIRLVPYWRPKEGFQFMILIQQIFTDQSKAHNFMDRLPMPFPTTSRIFADWQPDTVFFADPLFKYQS